jgi:O-acetyl-ADP-ribose deacetylase (regulator of RNase III)
MTAPAKTCFVIMPFKEKKKLDGTVIDFDAVYDNLIEPAVKSVGLQCYRSDKIVQGGWIHRKMLQHVYQADVAVVDLTTLNPNVFYELGVRHALVPCVTVLIRREGTELPFNIEGMNAIPYGDLSVEAERDKARKHIAEFITAGLEQYTNDSLVYEVLDVRVPPVQSVIPSTDTLYYPVHSEGDPRIALITGEIENVTVADVWVNSENTNMQMARHYDRSVSSLIRYLGARKDRSGQVSKDVIADELAKCMEGKRSVDPGVIVVTGAGELTKSNKVRKIFHAAAVVGQIGKGYTPINDVGRCVTNALQRMDSPALRSANLRTILFPLMGTGVGGGERKAKASQLITAALQYLRARPTSVVQTVYFLTWSQVELETCQRILRDAGLTQEVRANDGKRPRATKRPRRSLGASRPG